MRGNYAKANPSYYFKFKALLILAIVCLFSVLAGCTLPSDKTVGVLPVPASAATDERETIDARELLSSAVEQSNISDKAQSFWFNGYVRNAVQNYHVTSMYNGVVSRPNDAFIVHGRIAAQPFQYYGYNKERYINNNGRWYELDDDDLQSLPFDPFFGFADWIPFMDEAVQLPDEEVLGNLSEVIEVKIDAKDWVEHSPSALFDDLRLMLDASDDLGSLLENTVVKTTIWIGKEDRIIYQYRTWLIVPMPAGGYFDQEVYFRFYQHGDPSIEKTHLPTPENVRKWIKHPEEQELGEEQLIES